MDVKSKAVRSLMALALSQVFTKGLGIAKNVVLARLLAPNEFGLVATAYVLTETLRPLAAAGFHDAVIQRKDVDDKILNAGFTFSLASSCLVIGVAWCVAGLYANFYHDGRITSIVRVVSLSYLALGFIPETVLIKQL